MTPSEFVAALAPGTVIGGKYRVEQLLGKGGMGVVVAARHLDLNQNLAIKLLLPTAAASHEATTRFLREGRAAAQLTSPFVAKVFDTGRLPSGEPYLVMEFLRGRDLRNYLAEVGRVPLGVAVEWSLQAAHALAEAHALHIIHRDIKPANIFLTDTSVGQQIKVLDFGISKMLDAADDLTTTTATVGTPRYMAPEQMRSSKLADARGDVWSLGVVLYELTTGKPPFEGDSVTALCFDVMERTPTPPSTLNPALPAAFDAFMQRCLEKDPDERIQSMEAFTAALRGVVPDSPRFSGFLNAASLEPGSPVSGATPVPNTGPDSTGPTKLHPPPPSRPRHVANPTAVTHREGAPRLSNGPSVHDAPLTYVGSMVRDAAVPRAAPLPSDQPLQETMQPWNTAAFPRPAGAGASRGRLLAVGIGAGLFAAVVAGLVIGGLTSHRDASSAEPTNASPPPASSASTQSNRSTASLSTSVPASPSSSAVEPAVVPVDLPAPSAAPAGASATPSSPGPLASVSSAAAPPPPPSMNCNPPYTIDAKRIRHPKPWCY